MTRPRALDGRLVRLVALGLDRSEAHLLPWLGAALASHAGIVPVEGDALPIDPDWREPGQLRCSSNRIVDALIARDGPESADRPAAWTLALTSHDLVAPHREFVFGEATLGGAWAIVSSARLRDDGADAPDDLLRSRLLKEALHELGHLGGLTHCALRPCVMAPSPLPRDVDAKSDAFCVNCFATLTRSP